MNILIFQNKMISIKFDDINNKNISKNHLLHSIPILIFLSLYQ
jgi:hypothetical protein